MYIRSSELRWVKRWTKLSWVEMNKAELSWVELKVAEAWVKLFYNQLYICVPDYLLGWLVGWLLVCLIFGLSMWFYNFFNRSNCLFGKRPTTNGVNCRHKVWFRNKCVWLASRFVTKVVEFKDIISVWLFYLQTQCDFEDL